VTTIYSPDYDTMRVLLRKYRERAGKSQTEVAKALGLDQSRVAKIERGERRIDIIELRIYCQAVGISLAEFVEALEQRLGTKR
jgi:transcriptional regulator with XRE-family HTH domain